MFNLVSKQWNKKQLFWILVTKRNSDSTFSLFHCHSLVGKFTIKSRDCVSWRFYMQVLVVFCESYKLASNCNIQIAKRSQTKRKTAELSLAIPLNKTTESTTLQRIAEEARQKARDASQPLIRPSGKLRPGRPQSPRQCPHPRRAWT